MPFDLPLYWALLKKVFANWIDDDVPSMGAALAYYTLFSLAPLLLIVISVAGLVFGQETARGEIESQLRALMGDAALQWRDVWTSAIFTALLFSLGKALIGIYIGSSGIVSGFGAAGSLVVVLLWVYYSAQIFLMGAEFTWVYANLFGSRRQTPAPRVASPGRG